MRLTGIVAALLACLGMSTAVRAAEGAPAATPTFTKDVAPILYKSCVECHRPTMFAPMSLMTYEDARPWAKSVKQRVVSRAMPPWLLGSDAAVGPERGQVGRLVEQPEPIPVIAGDPEVFRVGEQLLDPLGLIGRIVRQGDRSTAFAEGHDHPKE